MIGRADGWPVVNDGGQEAGQVSGMERSWKQQEPRQIRRDFVVVPCIN